VPFFESSLFLYISVRNEGLKECFLLHTIENIIKYKDISIIFDRSDPVIAQAFSLCSRGGLGPRAAQRWDSLRHSGGLYGAELLPIDREFAHFATQRVRVEPQQTSRPVRSVDPAMGHRQGGFDVLFHRRVERQERCDGRC
jgi:hypothetical protein